MYLITSLGLIINYQKSDLIPTQIFTFIRLEFLTYSNIVRVPHPRVQKLLETIMIIYQKKIISARVFLSLLGQLSAAADCVMPGGLHLQPLQMYLLFQWRPQKYSLNYQIKLSANILHHLDWWKQEEIYQQGVPLRINPPHTQYLQTPACWASFCMWNWKDYFFMESGSATHKYAGNDGHFNGTKGSSSHNQEFHCVSLHRHYNSSGLSEKTRGDRFSRPLFRSLGNP